MPAPERAGDAPGEIDLLHVVGDGRPGGGTTVLLNLCVALAARGFRVGLISQQDSYIVQRAREAGIWNCGLDFSSRAATPKLSRQIHDIAAAAGAHIIHAHGSRAGLPVALRRRPGTSFVYTVHGFHFVRKGRVAALLGRAAERFCIARSNTTLFVGNGDVQVARRYRLLGSANSRVIYNGIAVPDIEMPAEKRFDVAFLGRLHHQKNPLILPDILGATDQDTRLVVIGDGDLGDEVRQKVASQGLSDRVLFAGECRREEALAYLAESRIMLLPSLWEGLPVAPMEAMSLGLPVVASKVRGNDEVVEDGVTGFLCEVEEPGDYARRLKELLADPALLARFGKAGADRVRCHFSIERQVASHVELYEELGLCAVPGAHAA